MALDALNKISYGVFVLSTMRDGYDNGCIINTVLQVTENPNRIIVTVNKQNYTCEMIEESKVLNVSVLSEKADFEIFKHFGFVSGREVNKFENYSDYERSSNGVTYITKGTNSYISGKVIETMDMGTHIIFVAEVTEMKVLNEDASATYDFYHKNIKPKPQENDEKKKWVCTICGYEYEGEDLPEDFICPWCKHPASDFEKR